ncbi:tetratricopeptide repeat protein, partial [Leptolyngbya sp. Heron Island J]|uniref:tetratricopeptide repeat protein n=1 Tax=Leptolyngbya sp. Heron Island J TaxID=1385935 RepID=UPI0004CF5161
MLASGLLVSTPSWPVYAAPLEAPQRLVQNSLEALNQQIVELSEQGRYEEAIPLAERRVEIVEAQLGPQHPEVAASLNNLAELYRLQGRYEEAEPLYQRSLGILEAQLGPQHPEVATNLNNLGLLYELQGRYEEAEPLYQRSLGILEAQLGPQHPEVA